MALKEYSSDLVLHLPDIGGPYKKQINRIMVKIKAAEADISWPLVHRMCQASKPPDPTFPIMQLTSTTTVISSVLFFQTLESTLQVILRSCFQRLSSCNSDV